MLKLTLALACFVAILWLGVACGEEIDPDYPCGQEALIYAQHVREVLKENRKLFERQPGRAMEHFIRDEQGNWSDEYGIVITVNEKVDQDTLPPEDRIPDEIDGVAVYFDEAPSNYTGGLIEGVYQEHLEVQYAYAAMWKYEDLFFRQFIPNYHPSDHGIMGVGESPGDPLKVSLGVNIFGKENALVLENRMPECVDGIPVTIHIIESDALSTRYATMTTQLQKTLQPKKRPRLRTRRLPACRPEIPLPQPVRRQGAKLHDRVEGIGVGRCSGKGALPGVAGGRGVWRHPSILGE